MNITAKNYHESIKNIDFSNAPEAIKSTQKRYENFAKHYGKNEGITEVLDIYFEQLSKWVNNATKNTSLPNNVHVVRLAPHENKKPSPTATKSDAADDKEVKFNTPNKAKKEFKKRLTKDGPARKATPKKVAVKKASKKSAAHRAPTKKARVEAKKIVIKTVKVKEPKAPVMRKIVSLELQVIKSYLAMDGKNVKPLTFSMLYGKIDKAIREKRIADHKTAIDEMHSKLKTIVEDIKAKNITTAIAVKFDNDFKEKLQKIVGSATERVRTSYFAGTGDKSYKEFIAEESKHAEGHTYRGKILFGQPVVLKEKNNAPVKKWAVDELEIANELAAKLNKAAKNFR